MRPANLSAIYDSIIRQGAAWSWYICFDTFRLRKIEGQASIELPLKLLDDPRVKLMAECDSSFSGTAQRNKAMDQLGEYPWVYFLDDDTALPPGLIALLTELNSTDTNLVFINQIRPEKFDVKSMDDVKAGQIGTMMFAATKTLIANTQWTGDLRHDWVFVETLLAKHPNILFSNLSVDML
jgi:hypothetical protein